jgi:hypothetical protein
MIFFILPIEDIETALKTRDERRGDVAIDDDK